VEEALRTFGAAVSALDAELDWSLLGRALCEGDGSGFFDNALRERVLDTALLLADDIALALDGAPGRSLYLGAEIAELPLILAEHLVLGRKVDWLNIECPATRELERACRKVGAEAGVALPLPQVRSLAAVEPGSCNHLWMVSVLTDPDSFPALHDTLYERAGSPLAVGSGSLGEDRTRAEAMALALLDRAAPRCVLSTTDEEWTLVGPLVRRRGWTSRLAAQGRISAIVGDRIRIRTLQRPA
jgi:hypothetical protein